MEVKQYDTLPQDAAAIRRAVFMEEQGFQKEFDEIDAYAKHLVMYDQDVPVAVCRLFQKSGTQSYIIGRIAVVKQYRGRKLGAELLKEAEKIVARNHGETMLLHAQLQAVKFYEKQGFEAFGEIEAEEHCPHIWMRKKTDLPDSVFPDSSVCGQ